MTEEEKREYQALQDTACSYHYEFGDIVDDFLYFDNDVDWLQAQTLFGIKPVRLLSTKRGSSNVNGKKVGVGRVLRGVDVISKIMKENGLGSKTNENK
jgi:hypothetical protein